MPAPKWFIYALGGGWGHLTRAVALARAAHAFARVRILTNSPHASLIKDALPELDIVALDPAMDVAGAREQVPKHIESAAPHCLIVDTLPRGLGGELADSLKSFEGVKVLIARDLNPEYSRAFGLDAFVESTYDLVLNPDEPEWLVKSSHELPPRNHARSLLRLRQNNPCIVICAAGNPEELAWYGAVVSHLDAAASVDVRVIAPTCPPNCPLDHWITHWPAIDTYPAASVVIGGAGYNTISECRACGVHLITRAWPRKYDRQWLRAARAPEGSVTIVKEPREAASAALRIVAAGPRDPKPIEFENGAHDAAREILSYCTRYGRSTQTSREPARYERRAHRF